MTIWPLIIISYFSLFVFGITDNIRGPIFPEILKDFSLSDAKGSFLFSMSSLSGFLVSFISIYVLKNFNRKRVLQAGTIVMAISLLLFAVTQSYFILILSSVLFGLSSGVLGLIPNILVPLGADIKIRQQLIAGLHSMYGIASLLAPLLVAYIAHSMGGWRPCFFIAIIFPLMLFIYTLQVDDKYFNRPVSSINFENNKVRNKAHLLPQIYLAFALSFTVVSEVMLSSRLPLYLRRTSGLSLEESSLYLTYFFCAMLIGRLLFSFVKFKAHVKNQIILMGFLSLISIYAGLTLNHHFLILAGFFISPFYPLMAAHIASYFPGDLDQAMSIVVSIDSVMLAIMHVFIGKVTDAFGIARAFQFGILFMIISISLVSLFTVFFKIKYSLNETVN